MPGPRGDGTMGFHFGKTDGGASSLTMKETMTWFSAKFLRALALVSIALLTIAGMVSVRAQGASSAVTSASQFTIRYSRDFKAGLYKRFQITLDQSGQGKFEATLRSGDLLSRDFQVSPTSLQQLLGAFDAAGFLSSNRDYESHAKVADMGMKTLFLARGGHAREARFNYTANKHITAIADFFDGLATTELRIDSLENAMKYDKLGLPDQMKGLQMEIKNRWLSETPLLLPVLRKIANNPALFNMVQREAHQIILQIESANPSTLATP